jgi:YHYH protein/Secretion system C-terminal sorting domain
MQQTTSLIAALFAFATISTAQTSDPMITSWWFNTTNQYYNSILVDVESVYYTTSKVYVKSSGVPNYYANGASNFNASDQTNIFNIPRTQTVATSATRTYLRDEGSVAVLIDGTVALSPCDGKSYNNAGVWHQIAYKFEGSDFDTYKGHSTPGGQYHHHVDPSPLYDVTASSTHSPIIGYAFDGYPVYGPYAYTNINGTGAIKRMSSSWKTRNITVRTTLPNGTTAASSGPAVGTGINKQALGKYFEDYEYSAGYGDLDEYNGRFCITPEYPSGTYCYFVSLDAALSPAFPYIIGDYFYGVAQYNGNMGPTSGNSTVASGATLYTVTVLPVELTAFEARSKNCTIALCWKTAIERNVKQFELQYSQDGKDFETVYTAQPKGNSSEYNYTHYTPTGHYYYRLKTVDFDGSSQYSPVLAALLGCKNQADVLIYPNPANDVLQISLNNFKTRNTATVFDGTGNVIGQFEVQDGSNTYNTSALPSGFYKLQIQYNTYDFIVQH